MKLRMPAPVKARSRTKKAQRKARRLPYDGSLYSFSPNGIVSTRSYEPNRNLLTSIVDAKDGTTLSHKAYSYDAIARPTTRQINERCDSFAYNAKSELTAAQLGSDNYGYSYDNIGNRKTAQEIAEEITYATNYTNEYTAINDFTPEFDADGNQTKLQTSTGIWNVEYNAENRPTKFTSEDGSTIVEAAYDYMGRRAWKKVTINGVITYHQAFIYRGYLQIAAENLIEGKRWSEHLILWDPTQPNATRPLAIEQKGTWFTYGLDLSKNVTELYTSEGAIASTYTYSPFGAVETTGETATPLQWSSEIADEELGLVYYNYRHYNPTDGRWINRDPIGIKGGLNLYGFVGNRLWAIDALGVDMVVISGGCNPNPYGLLVVTQYFDSIITQFLSGALRKIGMDNFRDRRWDNFIAAAEEEIRKNKDNLSYGEELVWLVEYDTYRLRSLNDRNASDTYLKDIEKRAKNLGVRLEFYHSKTDLLARINSSQNPVYSLDSAGKFEKIYMNRLGDERISRFSYFGHGQAGSINPSMSFGNNRINDYSISSDDIKNNVINKATFMRGAIMISCGCNTATPPSDSEPSFREVWSGYFGEVLYGVNGKTLYHDPQNIQPEEGARWIPFNPL